MLIKTYSTLIAAVLGALWLAGCAASDTGNSDTGNDDPNSSGGNLGKGGQSNMTVPHGGNAGSGQDSGTTGSCPPGDTEACWESEDGEPFAGQAPSDSSTCHAGERECQDDGSWGACLGAVGPEAADTCDPGNDANCNGVPNEDCACDEADGPRACTQGSACGAQECVDGAWGACEGDDTATRCNPDATDERQVCDASGVWTDDPCASGSACSGDGECLLDDGEECTASSECGSNECTSFYVDSDEDGHAADTTVVKACGTALAGHVVVADNLGDDCADDDDSVHPGATETCDGIDNDCDGDIDLDDGLALSGSVSEVGPTGSVRDQPDIAWSEEESLYGIVFNDTTVATEGIYFTALNQSGAVQKAVGNAGPTSDGYGLHLIWGGDNFGLTWFYASDGDIQFRTVGSNGSLGVVRDIHNGPDAKPQVARVGTDNWAVLYIDYASGDGLVKAKTVTAAGTVGSAVDITNQNSNFGYLVGTSSGFATATELANASAVASVYSDTLGSPASVTVTGSQPVMGKGPDGFAIAVRTGSEPEFYSYDDAGNADCGPVAFADDAFGPTDVVGTDEGYLIVSTGADVRAQLIRSDCSLGPLFTIDTSQGANTYTRVAGGSEGWGVVWQSTGSKVKRRFFGPKFCD